MVQMFADLAVIGIVVRLIFGLMASTVGCMVASEAAALGAGDLASRARPGFSGQPGLVEHSVSEIDLVTANA